MVSSRAVRLDKYCDYQKLDNNLLPSRYLLGVEMKMWKVGLVIPIAMVFLSIPCQSQASNSNFKGAFFVISYPSDFKVRPSKLNSPNTPDYKAVDSAFFTSPDGAVEFYVFSPLWNGTPDDIALSDSTEEALSQKTEEIDGIIIRRATVRAKDFSYYRSIEDIENKKLNTRRVFGIKYRDQHAYDEYKPKYLEFKNSLEQFSD